MPAKLFIYLAHTEEPMADLIEWLADLPEGSTVTAALSVASDDTPMVTFVAV